MCERSPRSGGMSLVLERRESGRLAFIWSQARSGNLLTAKRAVARKASPNRRLLEFCCVKKGRELREKSTSPKWGFQVSSRNIQASQRICEPCAHPTLHESSWKHSRYPRKASLPLPGCRNVHFHPGLWAQSKALDVFLLVPAQQTDFQWQGLVYICVSCTPASHFHSCQKEIFFTCKGFHLTCKMLASNLVSRLPNKLNIIELKKKKSQIFVLFLH